MENNEESRKSKKKLFIILGSAIGACAIAGASVGIYFAVKSNNSGKVTTTVNEQEFDKAVTNEGIDYLQYHDVQTKNEEVEVDLSVEISPQVCYTVAKGEGGNKQIYARKTGPDEVTYTQKEGSEPWTDEKTKTLDKARDDKLYYLPSDACVNKLYQEFSSDKDLNYSECEYLSDKKCYYHRYEKESTVNEGEYFYDFYINFENKKVSKLLIEMIDKGSSKLFYKMEDTYTYKKSTPKDPR